MHFLETIHNQNKVIVDLLSEANGMLKSAWSSNIKSTKYLDQFPIKTKAQLEEMKEDISEETKDAMVNIS